MRKLTEARREAILEAAAQEFGERGFEGASVAGIAARLGSSKQTVYRYFASKDELFAEVSVRTIDRLIDVAYAGLEGGEKLEQGLRGYGERHLALRQSPELVALARLVYGESGRTEIGRMVWQRGKMQGVARLGAVLSAAAQTGELCALDPKLAPMHFIALLEAELVDPVILRAREPASEAEISQIVDRAVTVFLKAYR